MSEPLNIAFVEPFYTGSHQLWANGLKEHSDHYIELFTLPGRHWKWRMHGAAITMSEEIIAASTSYDLIVCSDMMDVALLSALLQRSGITTPVTIYFHENQLTYPWSPEDRDVMLQRDRHYGWINYSSALVADRIWFNSNYHMEVFLEALPGFLNAFPDSRNKYTVDQIRKKSSVLHLALDIRALTSYRRDPSYEVPVLLWNHRWEYDKNPETFFLLCRRLKAAGFEFKLIVLGQHTEDYPAIFDVAKEEFQNEIIHWGYASSRMAYMDLLKKADIIPVTSYQDFFGASVVEAMAAGCFPMIPDRLAYREHLPADLQEVCIYMDEDELYERIQAHDVSGASEVTTRIQDFVFRYDWTNMVPKYDEAIHNAVREKL